MTSTWGPPSWDLIHTLCAAICKERFLEIKVQVIHTIISICGSLPCPDCSAHASQWLKKVDFNNVNTSEQLVYIMYQLHNNVNARLGKPLFPYELMKDKYKSSMLLEKHKKFIQVFNTNGNMKLLNESFRRKFVLTNLRNFLMTGIRNKLILCL